MATPHSSPTPIPAQHASDAQHWYDHDGNPAYTIIGANGKERNTTLRDARKYGYKPSVTMVGDEAAKPGLVNWKAQQVLLAALTLPRIADESESDYVARIMADSKAQATAAAERGTQIHAWIQQAYEGVEVPDEAAQFVDAVKSALIDEGYAYTWIVERSFTNIEHGYGGKVDLHRPVAKGIVLDIKTKERPDKFALYDEHAIQLAAYREGLLLPEARCGIIFVSTTGTPEAKVCWIEEEKLVRGWSMFRALLDYWYARTGLSRE